MTIFYFNGYSKFKLSFGLTAQLSKMIEKTFKIVNLFH